MPTRQISGLQWVKATTNPWPKLKRQPPGVKGLGVRYEKKLALALPQARQNPWFEFQDQNGRGFCSPDLLFEAEDQILVLECKLKNYAQAKAQLLGLYKPILAKFYSKPVATIAVLKHLSPDSPRDMIFDSLQSALPLAKNWVPILHWLGNGPV